MELDRLERNQVVRDRIISDLTADGTPSNLDVLGLLLGTLSDSDRTTLAKQRQITEAKSVEAKEQQAATVAAILAKISPNSTAHIDTTIIPVTLDDDDVTVVDGQMDIGVIVLKPA